MSERIREIKERFAFNLKLAESTGGATGAEYKDIPYLLDLVDSLQQQVKELQEGNRTAVESREIAVKSMRETCITSNQHYAKVVELMDQLAERDRTIDLLTKQITDEVGISAKAIAERDMFKTSFEHWNKEAHRVVNENSKLRKALEEIADSKKDMSGVLCRVAARQALGE